MVCFGLSQRNKDMESFRADQHRKRGSMSAEEKACHTEVMFQSKAMGTTVDQAISEVGNSRHYRVRTTCVYPADKRRDA